MDINSKIYGYESVLALLQELSKMARRISCMYQCMHVSMHACIGACMHWWHIYVYWCQSDLSLTGPDQFTSPLVTFQPEHSGMIPIVSLPDSVSGVPKEDDSEGLIRDARRIGTETDSSSIKQQFEVDWKIRTHHPGCE